MRDVFAQALGTLVGGLLLIVAAKVAGLLSEVNWTEVGKFGGIIAVILVTGIGNVILGEQLEGAYSKVQRLRRERLLRERRKGD